MSVYSKKVYPKASSREVTENTVHSRHNDRIVAMRKVRGWTQEELAERAGLSVRTVRNVELGKVSQPRASTLALLARALEADGTVGWDAASVPDQCLWSGPLPPRTTIVGNQMELERIARIVQLNRCTTFLGPGGVGKTRYAIDVAARLAPTFRDGVAIVEFGDLPREEDGAASAVMRRIAHEMDRHRAESPTRSQNASESDLNMLLVLDNTEHLPAATIAAIRKILDSTWKVHILATSRRRLSQRLGTNVDIKPLRCAPLPGETLSETPAVQLILRNASPDNGADMDLGRQLTDVAELSRRVGAIPRFLEFVAERMRALPVQSLLSDQAGMWLLRSDDHALLSHQRSIADSILWSLSLLTEEHRRLVGALGSLPAETFDLSDLESTALDVAGRLVLLSDLLEDGLVLSDTSGRSQFRLAPFVAEVIRERVYSQ